MELGTFGAILGYAMQLEEGAAGFYEAAARGSLQAAFGELARSSRKRLRRLERDRREGVAEMILESITGLDSDAYRMDLNSEADETELLRQAQALEETAARFYRDAAVKMPVREVTRSLTRMAQENEKRAAELEKIGQQA